MEDEVYVMLMMMRADDSYTPAEGCTAEELLKCITADDYDACIAACTGPENPEEPTNPGYAKVTGKAEASQNVALNAVDKKIGTVTLTAGENDTTVTAMEITKAGLWNKNDIANIQLVKNGEYVTSQGTLNWSNVAKLRFRPNLVIKAGKSETFDVVVSMAGKDVAQPGWNHEFSVTAVTVANGSFGGTPVKLGSLTTTNYEVAEAEVTVKAATNLKAGEDSKEMVRVTVASDVDATLKSITLTATPDGINEDMFNIVSNVKAYIDNKEVGTVKVNEETIVISNLNTDIEKNDDVDVVLKGSIIYVWASIDVKLEAEAGHVVVVENSTNERMNHEADDDTMKAAWSDLKITNNITTAQTASINEKNVVFLDMNITSSNEMDITEFSIKLPWTEDTFEGNFKEDEITLYIDGVDYPITWWMLGDDGVVLKDGKYDAFTVSSKTPVRVQIKWTPKTDMVVSNIELKLITAKNIDTNTSFAINGDNGLKKASHKTTVKWGNLTVSKATTPSANTIEMWAEEDVLFFKVKSPSEKVTLNEFDIVLVGNDTEEDLGERATSPVTNIAVYEKWGQSPIAEFDFEWDELEDWDVDWEDITAEITLEDANFDIEAGDTVEFVVKATFDNWTVVDLWNKYQATLVAIRFEWATSKIESENTTTVAWTNYTVVTEKPDLELTKNGKFINVTVSNESEYDVLFDTTDGDILVEVEIVPTVNDNYLIDNLADLGLEVLDWENWNVIWSATWDENVIVVSFSEEYRVSAWWEEEFTIKLVSPKQIKNESYNVAKKWADFYYIDAEQNPEVSSKLINVKY